MVSQGVDNFIWFIVVLFIVIGLLNLFFILVLDGGYLMFYVYEVVCGCLLSDCVVWVFMFIGFMLVLGLMIFGLINDLFCF